MKKIRVRRQEKKRIYAHNNISNAAYHIRKHVEEMENSGNREGIALYIMACLAMQAFTFEAKMNFIGEKSVSSWNERASFHDKIKRISRAIGYTIDKRSFPLSIIIELKEIRDSFAHAKPVEIEIDENVEIFPEEANNKIDLSPAWEEKLTLEFVNQSNLAIEQVWKEWLALAKIEPFKAITHGEYGITVIEQYIGHGT